MVGGREMNEIRKLTVDLPHPSTRLQTMAFPGLSQKIKQQYAQAIKNGTVLFTESEVVELDDEQTQIPVRPFSLRGHYKFFTDECRYSSK